MRRTSLVAGVLTWLVFAATLRAGQVVRLRATADIWVSNATPQECNTSSGKHPFFKIKSIQEMAAIRFDATPARGREVLRATLYMRRAGSDMLRYIRVSTVNGDWVEGNTAEPYGPPDGATFMYADYNTKRPWAWKGSTFADVIMTSGNTIATWAECRKLADGWIAVDLTPELIYALAVGDTDGLAVMDGGNPALHNNFIHSVQSKGSEPYIEVELGRRLTAVPAKPRVTAEPAPQRASLKAGAIRITIAEAENVFCWRLWLDDRPVERWRVRHPNPTGPTVFYLEGLVPDKQYRLKVVAVSPGGLTSEPAELTVRASKALPPGPDLGKLPKPAAAAQPPTRAGKMRLWACPGLVKISPEKPVAMYDDIASGDYRSANAVWDGRTVRLFGARGEYVSFQLCIERLSAGPLKGVKVTPGVLAGPAGATIGGGEIELFKNWYARNRDGKWQPAYCIPLRHGEAFDIPDPKRNLPGQQNQTVYVDIYIPKNAAPGIYNGTITVSAEGLEPITVPVTLKVYDFVLPDRLSFWPELNAYRIPPNAHDYYRLAHQHRCVLNCWVWRPKLRGWGKNIQVIWDEYDRNVGPLLSGEAFKNNRRAGAPVECMYLPFEDSWPTPLSKKTYNYQGYWPKRGDDIKYIIEHYMKAPYIGEALSQDYKDAFLAVQRQFIEHFAAKGWNRTEMQCFFGGKATHRIRYGVNMWWTTDEPYHLQDWLAVQFFCRLWTGGRGNADPKIWTMRADISYPEWQGRMLAGIVNTIYYGTRAFSSPDMCRRCRTLSEESGFKLMTYGSANRDNQPNTQTVVWILNAWTNGANGVLPWQTLGSDRSLDLNDRGIGGGNALLVPGKRFGLKVVGDMRLKALRDGQQIVEYLTILARRYGLQREQIKRMLHEAIYLKVWTRKGASADDADALRFSTLKAWQISELRRKIADLIVSRQANP